MGRSVVVTGATSGIGLATALELAGHGFEVIGTARSGAQAERLAGIAAARGLALRTVLLDVTDPESCVRAFTEVAALTDGGPWAVVNNAGVAAPGAIEDVDDDAVHQQFEVNVLAPARIARLVLPAMRQRGDGRIVNISSISARVTMPYLGWYGASKRALEAVSDALRVEAGPFGVRVVLVEPGSFGSRIWRRGAAALPVRDGSPYRAAMVRLAEDVLRRSASLPGPTPVARTVCRALRSSRPHARYLVGADARTTAVLSALAPTGLTDYASQIVTGLRQPPDGVSRVMSRFAGRRG
jgi:NAD(P)-dependent dehydrogenase (short-subunit alcohol dehydrogenase family)